MRRRVREQESKREIDKYRYFDAIDNEAQFTRTATACAPLESCICLHVKTTETTNKIK